MIDALNFNHPRLRANRSAVLRATQRILGAKSFAPAALNSVLLSATTRNGAGYLQEYCGVAAHYASKKLRQRA